MFFLYTLECCLPGKRQRPGEGGALFGVDTPEAPGYLLFEELAVPDLVQPQLRRKQRIACVVSLWPGQFAGGLAGQVIQRAARHREGVGDALEGADGRHHLTAPPA